MGLKYTEVGEHDYFGESRGDEYDLNQVVTVELSKDDPLSRAVSDLAKSKTNRDSWVTVPRMLMTTEGHWSGYSEYTVTSQWSEIWITVPDWDLECHYESMPEFFAALAEAVTDRP